jgi:cell division protein FtsZ
MQRTPDLENLAVIRVMGVGGGGSNAVDRMIDAGLRGVDFVALNTDAQALMRSAAPIRLRMGENTTRGLGSGGDPEIGRKSADESVDQIYQLVKGADMVFVTAGMGGGTGTGAAPMVAREARKEGALTIGVVTKPFFFEGTRRAAVAHEGIELLREEVDTLIVIPNDRLLELTNRRMSLTDSFALADNFLCQGIQGISELITVPGIINLDFADVKTIMAEGGAALMAVGEAEGDDRARSAAQRAIGSEILDVTIDGARGILFNITGGPDLTLHEVHEAAAIVRETAHPDANLIFGAVIDENLTNKLRITIVATGFEHDKPLQRFIEPRQTEATPPAEKKPPSGPVKTTFSQGSWARPNFAEDDLAIPAFLRRR